MTINIVNIVVFRRTHGPQIVNRRHDRGKDNENIAHQHSKLEKQNDELTAESSVYEILVLTETWLHPNILSEKITIPFFNKTYRKDRIGDAHGGIAIYTRSNLSSKHRIDLEIDNLEAT